MNSRTTHRGLSRSFGLGCCVAIVLASTASLQAQQQRYYQPTQGYPPQQGGYPQQQYAPPSGYQQPPPGYGYPQQPQSQYESPLQFLPKFGQRMSEMARRLFYGRDPTGYDNPPPGYGQSGGGYNLDSSPRQQSAPNYPQQSPQGYPIPGSGYVPQQPGYQYPQQQPPAQPRYNLPPPQHSQQHSSPAPTHSKPQSTTTHSKSPPPAPTPQSKPSSSSSTRKYTPPKVSDSPPPTKTTSKTATVSPKKEPKPDDPPPPPAPTPTTRRSESTPKEFPTTASSGASGSFLKGKKTTKPGRVISPYAPFKELDITGLESGSLALDPTTQKVFEVP